MTATECGDQLLDLGNIRMFCRTSGRPTKLPTFVLEAGAGGNARDTWPHVQEYLSPYSRVFSYDRANSGSSTTDGAGYGAVANSRRLKHLLVAAKVPGPYLLVGHSRGGLYVRHFAATYPEEVVGLVLLDATPTQMKVPWFTEVQRQVLILGLHWLARLHLVHLFMLLRGKRMEPKVARQVAEFAAPGAAARMLEEARAGQELQQTVGAITPLLRHPTLSILAGRRPGVPERKAAELQAMLASINEGAPGPLSSMVTLPEATHGSLVADPEHAHEVGAHILEFARRVSGTA
jgi:pimeloyl-ACP methyl ester carboxylesterase